MDRKRYTIRPCLGDKFARNTEDTACVEVKVPSLFEDQTTSWIKIVNGVEKYVREAMPIQEEERASVKPAEKARPTLKPSSTSKWDFIPDIEVQRSKDRYCFLMSKFITPFLRHKEVGRKENAGFPHYRIVGKCMDVLPDDSRYWSDEIEEKMDMYPYWSANKWTDVLSKGGGQEKRFQYCLKPICPEKLLYIFRAIQGHSGKFYS